MELNINQNGELIIMELPDKEGQTHVLEFVASTIDPSYFAYWIDRNDFLAWPMHEDGLYKYYKLPTNLDPEELKAFCTKGLDYFLEVMRDPKNSIGPISPDNEYDVFSIHNLRNCVLQMEKEAIWSFVQMCSGKNCRNKSYTRSTKDLLLIAIFVLENLISQERYTEAQMILDSLSTCSDICKSNKTFSCNCG